MDLKNEQNTVHLNEISKKTHEHINFIT